MKVIITVILLFFGNDNSKLHMYSSCIGMVLVTGMLYYLSKGIGHENVIHFCYCNSNRSRYSYSRSNIIVISKGMLYDFGLVFGI